VKSHVRIWEQQREIYTWINWSDTGASNGPVTTEREYCEAEQPPDGCRAIDANKDADHVSVENKL